CSKGHAHNLFERHNIGFRASDNYSKLAERFESVENSTLDINALKDYFRDNWNASPSELHLTNLKSGLLNGHNWHGAMPSMLHLSMQNKVRDHIDGKIGLDALIGIGADIMKHEYFMVCVHDLCETAIIEHFQDTIPPIGNK